MDESKRQQLCELKGKATKSFADVLLIIAKSLHSRDKKNAEITKIKDYCALLGQQNPGFLTNKCGPFLWKYRDQIKDGTIDKLVDDDFDEEIRNLEASGDTTSEKARSIVNAVKKSWLQLNPTERNIIKNWIRDLLKNYALYVSASKMLGY